MTTTNTNARTIRFVAGIVAACVITATAAAGPDHNHKQNKDTNEVRTFELVSQDGPDKYEIVVNGEDVTARVNGLRVTGDRIKQADGMVMILDDSGDVVKKFSISPGQSTRFFDGKVKGVIRSGDNQNDFRLLGGNDGKLPVAVTVGHPPVMLGVLLDSPGEALRAQLGVSEHAILIEKVMDGLPADKAGLRQWDIVVAIDGEEIDHGRALLEILMDSEDGDEIELTIIRGGKEIERTLELEAYDAGRLGRVTADITIEADGDQNDSPFGLLRRYPGQESADRAIAKAIAKLEDLGSNNQGARQELERLVQELSRNSSQWMNQQGNLRMLLDGKGRLLELDDNDRDELEDRFEELEEQFDERLEELEERLEDHWDKMEDVFDRMFDKVERLLEESRD